MKLLKHINPLVEGNKINLNLITSDGLIKGIKATK